MNCPSSEPNCVKLHVTIVYKMLPHVFPDQTGLMLEQQTLLGLICHQQTTQTVTKGWRHAAARLPTPLSPLSIPRCSDNRKLWIWPQFLCKSDNTRLKRAM